MKLINKIYLFLFNYMIKIKRFSSVSEYDNNDLQTHLKSYFQLNQKKKMEHRHLRRSFIESCKNSYKGKIGKNENRHASLEKDKNKENHVEIKCDSNLNYGLLNLNSNLQNKSYKRIFNSSITDYEKLKMKMKAKLLRINLSKKSL